jgi:hypothetical protein
MKTMMKIFAFILIIVFFSSCPSDKTTLELPTVYKNGVPVLYEERINNIQTMGTENRGGIQIIYYNPDGFNNVKEPNRKFFIWLHEICHLSLPTHDEDEANCCALKIMDIINVLSDKEISFIISYKSVEQSIGILECYQEILDNKKKLTN